MSKPDYLISTPENVDLHLELAGLGNRVLASLIDTLLTWAILIIIMLFLGMTAGLMEAAGLPDSTKTTIYYCIVGVCVLLFLSILFGYYVFFEGMWQGQTPGKKVARIRVIEQSGQPVGWPSVIIRNLIRPVDMGVMLIGLVSMVIDRNERRLGDLTAGTMVIRERHPSEGARALKLTTTAPDQSFVDIGRVTPVEYDLIVSFLGRRELMSRQERPAIARQLADYFREKLTEAASQEDPEIFLEKLYLSYQARAEQASA